jgi:uncharacterized protein YbjT (DUF2867 family)
MTILITGASGHLDSQIVGFLSQWNDPSTLIGTSRNASNATSFTAKGVAFRETDFAKPDTLAAAFVGVDKLMIISTMDYDTDTRFKNQKNAIDAAIAAQVGHVYYTSGAFGGYSDSSQAHIQQADYLTEDYLKR